LSLRADEVGGAETEKLKTHDAVRSARLRHS